MAGTFSLRRALVLATCVHAVAIGLTLDERLPATRVPVQELATIAIELPSGTPVEQPATPKEEPPQPSQVAGRPARQETPALAPREAEPLMASSASVPLTGPPSSKESGWQLLVRGPRGSTGDSARAMSDLGLDGKNHFLGTRRTEAEEQQEALMRANQAAGEAIRGALHDHDVGLGIGSGGPVVSAVEDALRESLAPNEGRAVLVAVADASGVILRVDVETSSDDAAFREIAADLLKRMRGQKVRVPPGAKGVAMRIDVASKMSLPSGGSIGIDPKNLGGHFDFSDVGARPRRVVHAHVLAEELL